MLKNIFLAFVSVLIFSCSEDNVGGEDKCSTPATLRDLTGLDGCGFVFELDNGTRLEPLRMLYCGTPPLPKEVTEDPLYNFEWVDGKRVLINYELSSSPSICMVGQTVKITCISEAPSKSDL